MNKQEFISKEKEEYMYKIAGICNNVVCKACGKFNYPHKRMCRNCGNEIRND